MGLSKVVWCDGCGEALEKVDRRGAAAVGTEIEYATLNFVDPQGSQATFDLCEGCSTKVLGHLQSTYGATKPSEVVK